MSSNARASRSLTVLMFHGIVKEMPAHAVFPGSRTCMIRECDFDAVVRWCTRRMRIATLDDLPRYVCGEATEPGVLITFDDGLSSVVDLALPILRRHQATAVLFVTTGWVDSQASPAIFRLERALWENPPRELKVRVRGEELLVPIGKRAMTGAAVAKLWAWCLDRRVAPVTLAPDSVLLDDRPWTPGPSTRSRDEWFPATWDDIADARRSGTLEIGAHGATHTPWSWLSAAERRREIAEPFERLRSLIGDTVATCSYPHGLYDDDARAELRRHYAYAFTTRGGIVSDEPVDLLPRFHVPSERPVDMRLIVRWPLAGRVLRKGTSLARLLGERAGNALS